MVRMRPCAEGAQAPHWLPLCSCYCCHCSCAVSGQSHNASCVAFINVLSLSSTQSYCLWLITPALFLLVFLFVFLTLSLLLFSHLCFRFVPLLHVFFHCFPTLIFLTCQSLLRSTTICLHLPPQLTSQSLSVSRQHFLHLTWLWTSSHALCIFPHLSLSVSGNRLPRLSLLPSDYWCSQTLAKTDHSLLICIETFARLF